MIRLRRVAACTVVSLWLVGCTNDNSTSAPISSVGGDRSGTMLSGANTDSSGGASFITVVTTISPKEATAVIPIPLSVVTRCFISLG